MGSYVRDHIGAVSLSVLLHVAIVMGLIFSVSFGSSRVVTAPAPSSIEVVVVDQNPVEVLQASREAERVEQQRIEQARVEREREEQRQEQLRIERVQQEREAEQQRVEEARLEAERVRLEEARIAAETEEQQRREAEAEQRRLAEERRLEEERQAEQRRLEEERLEQERRLAEERRRQEAQEQALMEALAAEEAARQAEQEAIAEARRTGEFDRYIRRIQAAIQNAWIPPASARPGLECVIYVTQIPSGDVTSARIGECNGDEAVRRSIEVAVLRASPLPTPGIAALFDRNLEVTFRPED